MNDSQIQAQAYGYFLTEAPELLQTIEQEILTLPAEHTTAKVHNLMRALHTLKGAAANVGLATIERIAHDFEDVARVFYNLEVEIDPTIQSLLLEGYSGLQACLDAQMVGKEIDEVEMTARMLAVIDRLKLSLGDWSETESVLPTSLELGFDIVASIFETTIQEQIDELRATIASGAITLLADCLQNMTEICIGLAESFELPGFLAINQTISSALTHHPDRLELIAQLALTNLQQAQSEVLAGDRTSGGTVLPDLANLVQSQSPQIAPATQIDQNLIVKELPLAFAISGEAELPGFHAFLNSDGFRTRQGLHPDTQNLFDQIIRLSWDWFAQNIGTPPVDLTLELLVTSEGLADLDYLNHWIGLLLQGVSTPSDRLSLQLYRQSCLQQVVFAIAKYLGVTNPHHQITPEFLTQLRLQLQTTVTQYKQQSPVTINERGWLDRIILPHHWTANLCPDPDADPLLSEIWGQSLSPDPHHQVLERLQALLLESHDRSIQQHQQLQALCTEHPSRQLAELIAGSSQLSTDLAIALETISASYQVAARSS